MKRLRYILALLCLCFGGIIFPQAAQAFFCNFGPQNSLTPTFKTTVTLNKTTSTVVLFDFAKSGWTCTGDIGTAYRDALGVKENTAFLDSRLVAAGFTGRINNGAYNAFPVSAFSCFWPDNKCTVRPEEVITTTGPMRLSISMTRDPSIRWVPGVIPAGTVIATFGVRERGVDKFGAPPAWRGIVTWRIVTNNDILLPAYSCTVNNPNQTVTLPPVSVSKLTNNGPGKYPEATPFNINLTCENDASVSVKFDGKTLPGKDNVLADTSTNSKTTGIQVELNNEPVSFVNNTSIPVITHANKTENIPLKAYYYYNGGGVTGGKLTSVATFTLTYN